LANGRCRTPLDLPGKASGASDADGCAAKDEPLDEVLVDWRVQSIFSKIEEDFNSPDSAELELEFQELELEIELLLDGVGFAES
jgi:hypothetical protein